MLYSTECKTIINFRVIYPADLYFRIKFLIKILWDIYPRVYGIVSICPSDVVTTLRTIRKISL